MAHKQQIEYCNRVKALLPKYFSNRIVLDIGSLDINGNNQHLFDDCLYLGVDLMPGKNVDFAVKGHELSLPDNSVDVIVSTECLEHDQFYPLTFQNMVRMLKPGGLLLLSCATTGRPEHGTRRTTPFDAPFTQEFGDWGDYYKNLEESDIRAIVDIDSTFGRYAFATNLENFDLYFWGVKKGALADRHDYSFQVRRSAELSRFAQLFETVSTRDNQISNLHGTLATRDAQLASQSARIASLQQTLLDRDAHIVTSQQTREEQAMRIGTLQQALTDRDAVNAALQLSLSASRGEVTALRNSNSWRLTGPLRFVARLLRRLVTKSNVRNPT